MTLTQVSYKISHFFTARHYRGHGIHSPYLYSFVREIVLNYRNNDICTLLKNKYPGKEIDITCDVSEALSSKSYITVLTRPFTSHSELKLWRESRPKYQCLTVHLPDYIIILRDSRLHNLDYRIRQ